MVSSRFPDAVVVWLDPRRRDSGVKFVESVPEALFALHHHGLEEVIRSDRSDLWKAAAGALVQAEVDPNTSNLRAAYEAFLRLVKFVAPVPSRVRMMVSPRRPRERVDTLFLMT